MKPLTIREQIELYATDKYKVEVEQLPFNQEDYAILRHKDTGKWFAVFIVKPRKAFGLTGDGDAEVMSIKIKDQMYADFLMQQDGYFRGFPSSGWNWTTVILDGMVPYDELIKLLDGSYEATKSKVSNKKTPLPKKSK